MVSEEEMELYSAKEDTSPPSKKKVFYNAKLGMAEQKGYSKIDSVPLPRSEQVDSFVKTLMEDPSLEIAHLPYFIRLSVYKLVTEQLLAVFLDGFYHGATGSKLLGHHVDLYFSELDTDANEDRKTERYGKKRKPIAMDHIEELVDRIMERNEINVGVLPDVVERSLYNNVLYVTIHLIQTMLKCTEMDFAGYAFKATFDMDESNPNGQIPQIVRNDLGGDNHCHEVDPVIIDKYVEEALKGNKGLTGGLESKLERPIFSAVYKLAAYVMHEVLKDLKLSVMGDNFRMRIMPGDPGDRDSNDYHKYSKKHRGAMKKKKRLFTTKWVKKRLNLGSPSPSKEGAEGEEGKGGLLGMGIFTKERLSMSGKKKKDEGDEEEDGSDNRYRTPVKSKLAGVRPDVTSSPDSFWSDITPSDPVDEERGIDITWRTVEGQTLQEYLDSYRPPRHVPFAERLEVREDQVHDFTMSVLMNGDYHIPGVPIEAEIFLYKEVIKTGLQTFLTTFHDTVKNTRLFGHHLELDIEEGTRPFSFTQKPTNIKAVAVLVDTLLEDSEVNLSLLPDFVERKLYTNVILMCLLLVQNVCDSSCMDFVGHSLQSKFSPLNEAVTSKLRSKIHHDAVLSEVPDSKIDQGTLRMYVEHDKEDANEILKLLYSSVYRISLYVAREVLLDININVLEDGYLMRLAPGDPQK